MASLIAANGGSWIPFVIFLVVIGFKVISAIAKASKEAGNRPMRDASNSDGSDLWEPMAAAAKRAAPPPVPATAKSRKRRSRTQTTPPPVPGATVPDGVSAEAAQSIHAMESSDDRFERQQDQAYDFEFSDVPETSEDAFSLTRRSRKSRKKNIKINFRGKHLRDAVITREILAPPRCFDI